LLAIEFALYPRERKSDYPFNLPYFEVFNRLMEVSEMLKKIVMWNAWHNKVSWVVLKLDEYLKTLIKSSEVMILSNKIKHIRLWFEEALGQYYWISPNLPKITSSSYNKITSLI
jgi:hypothetical protein